MASVNRQVWQNKTGVPGIIRDSKIPSVSDIRESQLVVKVHAWAMNPCDAILQKTALPFVKYPVILGQDVAGTVEAVGSAAASRFKKGDCVFGASINNGFQEYVALENILAAKIPDNLSCSEATVFPLTITTTCFGLFAPGFLELPHPTLDTAPCSAGKSVLIWGASSSVGSNAVQMAAAAGLDVIATSSSSNFDYVKGLGATKAFDYKSPSVIDDVVAELDKGTCAGILLAAGSVADACQVSHRSRQKLLVASSNPPKPEDAPEGVEVKFIFADGNDMGPFELIFPVAFGGYLPEALGKGKYKIAPPPEAVSTKGLEGIQEALDLMKKGVSAKKLVVVD